MQQQVRTVNEMVQKLKEAMPSDELVRLVEAMQEITKQKFDLQLLFSEKENELLENENQLRLMAKNDVGLSQKVINLRKQITEGREHLKDLQRKKIKFQEAHESVLKDLQNCEVVERRRNEVAIETEQTLSKAKAQIEELNKELLYVNNNRRDLENAVHGLQEQNSMLTREL